MARRTKQEAQETREKVMAAAVDIIYEKGYARTTFVDIANEIELSKGAVYWHFKTKPDLFLALGKTAEERVGSLMKSMLEKTQTLTELKEALGEMIFLMSRDELLRKYYTIVYYRMEWTKELLSIKQFFDDQDRLMMEWIKRVLEMAQLKDEIVISQGGGDISTLATALYSVVGGLLGFALSQKNETQAEQENVSNVIQMGIDVFFQGILKYEK